MTYFYIGLFHNSKKKKKKKTLIDQEIFNMMLRAKKYAPNRTNWVQKFKISLRKGALPPCNPRQGALPPGPLPEAQPPGTPVIAQQFGPPFSVAGSTPECERNVKSLDVAFHRILFYYINKAFDNIAFISISTTKQKFTMSNCTEKPTCKSNIYRQGSIGVRLGQRKGPKKRVFCVTHTHLSLFVWS